MGHALIRVVYRVPMQDSLGRRPVLLLSTAVCLAANLWRALAQDYKSFMWASVLNGFGAGPSEVFSIVTLACNGYHLTDFALLGARACSYRRRYVPPRTRRLQHLVLRCVL